MIMNNKPSYSVGLYLRLSREDGDKIESDSIHSQRELLMDFISRNRMFRFRQEYIDDGYSGTNFDRPSFKRMMADAEKGVIDCVMVKDLSRFGRNYIETGKYLERIIPAMGLRLISVNDNYDTLDRDSSDNEIVVPFKNLINDAYCRDISLKIRSHLDVKRRDGQFIGSFAMYGYKKDPKDKNHLVIDEDAAKVVELIFQMKVAGCSAQRIASRLNELGFHPPYEYKRKQGLNYNSGFKSKNKSRWTRETVSRILANEMYTGTMIQGKTKRINYKVRKSIPIVPEDWIRVKNTHAPIIKESTFEMVKDVAALDTRVAPEKVDVYPLSGYVKCGSCGQNMVRRSAMSGGRKYYYYHCSTYKAGGACTAHLINSDKVEKIVLDAVRKQIELLDKTEAMIAFITENGDDRFGIKLVRTQIEKLKDEIEHYGDLKAKLYRDMVEGLIDRNQFNEINVRFDKSRSSVEKKLYGLEAKERLLLTNQLQFQPWVENLKKYRGITELSRSMVVSTIDCVIINSAKEVAVRFKFGDELNEIIRFTSEEDTGGSNGWSELHEKSS